MGYWNNRAKSCTTFQGPWTRSGDKYSIDADGCYVYSGRSDDMLKVGGIYVSPIEVESALITHPAVLEAAVIGKEDDEHLTKPVAYVVLKGGQHGSDALAEELRAHVKAQLAPYKYPRWIEFIDELPKTATGKIQRFKLRAEGSLRVQRGRAARASPARGNVNPEEEHAMTPFGIPAPPGRDRRRGRGRRAARGRPRARRSSRASSRSG